MSDEDTYAPSFTETWGHNLKHTWDTIVFARRMAKLDKLLSSLAGESNLVEHIKREVPDGDDEDEMQDSMKAHLIRMGQLFSIEGHSGFSASWAVSVLDPLLRFEPLSPLTGEHDEWWYLGFDREMTAQNKRCSHVFLRSDGTAYDIEAVVFREPNGVCFTNSESVRDVSFPYTPSRMCVDVSVSEEY